MENKINLVPTTMDKIPAKLFNSQYLSDVTFIVENKQIHAHSLLLMVRSSVFQEQLETTLGEKKIITITDYKYDVFYQFIRFIYTDKFEVSDVDWFYLMRLAKEYNVISLEKHLLNKSCSEREHFTLCVMEKHKIVLKTLNNDDKMGLFYKFVKIMDSAAFLSLHSDFIEAILKIDEITVGVSEFALGGALARWMNHYCEQNQIQFSECRRKFDHLVSLIRFPAMSCEQVRNITVKYPYFLTKSEIVNIATHKVYGAEYDEGIWNFKPRMQYKLPYTHERYSSGYCYTKFTVSCNIILGGFVFGEELFGNPEQNIASIAFSNKAALHEFNTFELGSSISVNPGCE